MMRLKFLCVVAFFFLFSGIAGASGVEDQFMRGVFKYLAKNRNMNLIAYSGEKVAENGRLYFIEEPNNPKTLSKWAKSGRALKLFFYKSDLDLSMHEETQKEENYIIGEKYSDFIGAELQATLKNKGIDIQAFKKALRNAQIRFTVMRKVIPAVIASNSIQADKQKLIAEFNHFGMGAGFVMPFQQLIVADFRYNEVSSKELEAMLGVGVLKTVKGKLTAKLIKSQDLEILLPASSTIAIKPFPIYFKETAFWGRWF